MNIASDTSDHWSCIVWNETRGHKTLRLCYQFTAMLTVAFLVAIVGVRFLLLHAAKLFLKLSF